MKYPIALHTDDNNHFGVTVPDLPGCFSSGDSIEEAIESVKEAIDLHAEGLIDEGMDIPPPSVIATHRNNPEYDLAIWAMVDVDLSRFQGKAEKINITIPKRILAMVDTYARNKGETRSGFLTRAAQQVMERHG